VLADALKLTQDHKPILLAERKRVEATGGTVENGRVNGRLEVSRSFGDVCLKESGVIATPDVRVKFEIDEARDEFLLLACDGLWTRFSPETAVGFVRGRIHAMECHRRHYGEEQRVVDSGMFPERHWTTKAICKQLVNDCIHEKGCTDNTTAMVVRFGNVTL